MKHVRFAGIVAAAVALAALLTACPNGGEAPGTEATIATFVFEAANNDALSADVTATISTDGTVTAAVPHGTAITALVPTITLPAGATVDPATGVAQDFTDPVTYTVTAEDGETSADFTVTVTVASADASTACDITDFVFEAAENTALSSTVTGTVGSGSVTAEVPFGTEVTALVPTITISDAATVDPASGTAQNFSSSVIYTVTAEDAATTQEYTVTVSETDAVIVGGNVFQELNLTGEVTTIAGVPRRSGNYDGTGTGPLLSFPKYGVEAGGYIYFSEDGNDVIRRFDPDTATVSWFSGSGSAGYNEGTAENAQFNNPRGLATDGTYLYVADELNHVVRKVSLADGSTELVAGQNASPGFADDTAGLAQFDYPIDLCYHDGYLYVADDSNRRVRKVDTSDGAVTTLAGDGTNSHTDETGTAAQFRGLDAIAFDGTDLWVASYHTIRKVTLAGVVTTPYGSPGNSGHTDSVGNAARFSAPHSIVAGAGVLYVGEDGNQTIRKIDTGSGGVSTLAGDAGNAGVADGIQTAAQFRNPSVMAVVGSHLYAVDYTGYTVRRIEIVSREVVTVAGTPTESGFNDGSGVGALSQSPTGVTTDGEYLYFTESTGSHLIRKMDIATAEVSHIAGSYGWNGETNDYADSLFDDPAGITITDGALYLCDDDNHTIRKIMLDGGQVSTFAGDVDTPGTLDGDGTTAQFDNPQGITTDGTSLFVADTDNHTIRRIDIASGGVTTLAGTAGTSGNDDGDGTAATFDRPAGITTDGTNLYVADQYNHTIRKIVIASGEVTTFAGSGIAGTVDDPEGTFAQFNQPRGIACDGANLYVTTFGSNMVRKINLATTEVTIVAGDPGSSNEWADGTGMSAQFDEPDGIVCDGTSVWVMDNDNQVLRQIE